MRLRMWDFFSNFARYFGLICAKAQEWNII